MHSPADPALSAEIAREVVEALGSGVAAAVADDDAGRLGHGGTSGFGSGEREAP